MSQNRSRDDLIQFLEYLGDKGLIPRATASARRTAATKVLSVLSDDEAQNVLTVDIDHVMACFDNLNPRQYTPESLQSYRSRLKTSLEDFRSYSDNPVAFRPNGQSRQKAKSSSSGSKIAARGKSSGSSKAASGELVVSTPPPSSPLVDLPNVNQLPIPLRQNLTVRIYGLPFDLTKQEAQKISNIILAHASPD
ncbi:hypothetical protein [Novosphingobium sp.]|uniref:hypothetical protein n=1 Tax=Novosphingobium sp. TaxID=1874826 RepID=UPI00286A428D|nr:hypothetical protein [Novosphingobium sp.]